MKTDRVKEPARRKTSAMRRIAILISAFTLLIFAALAAPGLITSLRYPEGGRSAEFGGLAASIQPGPERYDFDVTVENLLPFAVHSAVIEITPPRGIAVTDRATLTRELKKFASGDRVRLSVAGHKSVFAGFPYWIFAVLPLAAAAALWIWSGRKRSASATAVIFVFLLTGCITRAEAGKERRSQTFVLPVELEGEIYECRVAVRYETDPEAMNVEYGGGNWDISESGVTAESGSRGTVIGLTEPPGSYAYTAEMTLSDLTGRAGMLLCVSDGGGYFFGVNAAEGKLEFARVRDGAIEPIAAKNVTIEDGVSYEMRVEAYSGLYICYFDSYSFEIEPYPAFSINDSTFTGGRTGFLTYNQGSAFTKINVEEHKMASFGKGYKNPIMDGCADPFVLYHNGTYYLYATDTLGRVSGFYVYTSKDLVKWEFEGTALKAADSWGSWGFWAPEVIEKDGVFYMYYSVEEHLCVATSTSPLGPFRQEEKKPMHEDIKEIDSHVFLDGDGKYYIYFVRFGGGNHIWGAELGEDMSSIVEETLTLLLSPSADWERSMAAVNEGPFMLKFGDTYFLTYSGDHYQSPGYGVGYATSDSPLGKFEKYENNPIMQSNETVHGTGHHSFVFSPDGSELFMVYHCHSSLTQADPRKLCIDRAKFTTDNRGRVIISVYGPTTSYQPLPSGAAG